jgi:chromosomal replication initiation ATPase DnaA
MSKKTQTLIIALQESIDKIGLDKTISNLKEAADESNKSTKDFIIYQVCEYYKVEVKSLESSSKNNSQIKISQVLSYLLYYQGFLTQEEIGNLLGRSKASINRYVSELLHLSDSVSPDKDLKKEIKHIESKITEFKENIYG